MGELRFRPPQRGLLHRVIGQSGGFFDGLPELRSSEDGSAESAGEAFANLDKLDYEYAEADHQLARAMSDYWVAFAATGDPNPLGSSDLPAWPEFKQDTARHLEFGSTIEAGSKLHEARMALWDRFFEVTLP